MYINAIRSSVLVRTSVLLMAALAWLAAPLATAQGNMPTEAVWADLLDTYVSPGPNGVNRVDYGALKASEDDRERLDSYISAYSQLEIGKLSRDEQFVAWVNLYNAVTIRYIVRKYPVETINPWYSRGPWRSIKVSVNGKQVSLHQIEHDILRKQWADEPRLHYALNCASIGCPNLKTTPWQTATLEEDLDAAARAYINHPRGVSRLGRGLRVSSIYKWYKDDFGGSEAALLEHFLAYAEPALAGAIRETPAIRDYTYDWSLNETGASS